MDVGVTFAHPNSIFVKSSVLSDHDIKPGEPVQINFSEGEPVYGKAQTISDIDIEKEKHAMFFTVPDIFDDIPDNYPDFSGNFDTRGGELGERATLDIGEPEEFNKYLGFIDIMVNERDLSSSDVVIGNGLLQYQDDGIMRENLIQNQLVQSPEDHFLEILKGELPPKIVDLERFDGPIYEPSELFICSNTVDYSSQNIQKLRNNIINLKYLAPSNLLFPTPEGIAHGPVFRNLPDDFWSGEMPLLRVSADNLKIISVYNGDFHRHGQDYELQIENAKVVSDAIHKALVELEMDNLLYSSLNSQNITIYFQFEVEIVFKDNERLDFFLKHATPSELDEINDLLSEISQNLQESLDGDDEIHYSYRRSSPADTATINNWVLDTNSVYRQTSSGEMSPIDDFILNVRHIYNKDIIVPIESLIEINRHKDEGGGKRSLSKRGMKNVKILHYASEFGIIDFSPSEIPNEFDNRIHPDTGATDFAILQAAQNDGILISNDQNLLEISECMGIPNIDVTSVSDLTETPVKADAWSIAVELASDGEYTPEEFRENLFQSVSESFDSDELEHLERSEIDGLVDEWVSNRILIFAPDPDQLRVHLSKSVDIVPTYSVAIQLADQVVSIDGVDGQYLSYEVLENVRRAIGGLPKNQLPHLNFHLPERYVHRAEEVNQVSQLFTLTQTNNIQYKSEKSQSFGQNLEQAGVNISKEAGITLLCSETDRGVYRLSNLLEVDAKILRD